MGTKRLQVDLGDMLHFDPDGGFPVRGPIPIHKKDEPRQLEDVGEANVEVFDLADPEQLQAYRNVLSKVANGLSTCGEYKTVYDRDTKNWRVLIHWTDWFQEQSKSVRNKKAGLLTSSLAKRVPNFSSDEEQPDAPANRA